MFKQLIILFLLLLPISFATEYYTGEIQNVYNISRCEGPIKIKVLELDEIKFDKCVKEKGIFNCQCNNKFNINFLTDIEKRTTITIEYYTKYQNNNSIENENYKNVVRLDNVNIINNDKTIISKLDIDPIKVLFIGGMFALLLIVFIITKFKKDFNLKSDDYNDSLNYVTTDKEIDDIFEKP